MTRWARTCGAIRATSSGSATRRPARTALARTAAWRWTVARGLAPSVTSGSSRVRAHDRDEVAGDVLRDDDAVDEPLQPQQPGRVEEWLDVFEHVRRHPAVGDREHLELVGFGRVVDRDAEEEAVELRGGQPEDALVLERVLRRDHDERHGQPVAAAVDRDVVLLHRLEQRGLRARLGAVDLVRKEDVREHRTGRERPLPELDDGLPRELARTRVRRELDARELDAQRAGERAGEQRLRDPGRALEQDVAARDGRRQQQLDRAAVPHDHLADLGRGLVEERLRRLGCGRSLRKAGHPSKLSRESPGSTPPVGAVRASPTDVRAGPGAAWPGPTRRSRASP